MVQMYSGKMQQKLHEVEGINNRVRGDEEKMFEDAKKVVYARLFDESNVEVRGLKITKPWAEGQSSRPAKTTIEEHSSNPTIIEDESPKLVEPIMEGQSSKPSKADDEAEGVHNLLNLSPLKGDKDV
ncbi:Hypothetical predicted protein [Prunus dulcis]|uniref:Uncharacterized protein n=1 Tax=Prunus dulcis TaxID=3755 RepID=A0A5E4GEX6_PRUDU|nr:Hypothetical predicted protein [Prunus dulcis]